MISEGTRGFRFMVLMSVVGLASGMLTAAISDGHFSNGLGMPFGVVMAFSLVATGAVHSLWKAVCLFVLISCAFDISVMCAVATELAAHRFFYFGSPETPHPIALFVGGMAGGFIVLSGALFIANPETRLGALARVSLRWSVLGGALAPIAWALGPSLGAWVWSCLHAVGLTTPTNTLQNVLYGETGYGPPNRLFSLFVMWQTGIAFALGIALRRHRAMSSPEELKLI